MKTINRDKDSLTLYVKNSISQKIIEYYNILGWELVEECEDKKYEDITDLTFTRPHKIKNKDELQLLQVYMEERINGIAKLNKFKNTWTLSLALSFGVLGLALIAIGLLSIFNILTLGLVLSIICVSVGAILWIVGASTIPIIHKKEKQRYKQQFERLMQELEEICNQVKKLKGGHNE